MGGLAAAIGLVMLLMLLAGFGISFWLGRLFARARGWQGGRARGAAVFAGFAGAGLGMIAVTATFYESSFSPPPRLDVTVPAGFKQDWAILIEDPRETALLEWQGSGLPFTQRYAVVALPASGVLRVKAFGEVAGRGDLEVRWSNGVGYNGYAGGPAPPGTGGTAYIALGRAAPDGMQRSFLAEGEALAAEIARREDR